MPTKGQKAMMDLRIASALATSDLQLYRYLIDGVAFWIDDYSSKRGYQIFGHDGDQIGPDCIPTYALESLVAKLRRQGIEPGRIHGAQGSVTYAWRGLH